jgi:hypothetical protein
MTASLSLKNVLEPGERLLAGSTEVGSTGDIWFVSDRATYVDSKSSRSNARAGHERLLRIPHASVTDIVEAHTDDVIIRTLYAAFEGEREGISGRFPAADDGVLTRVLSERTSVDVRTVLPGPSQSA